MFEILRFWFLQAIHCDVKLENVLIKKSPVEGGRDLLKIADFGLLTPLRCENYAQTTKLYRYVTLIVCTDTLVPQKSPRCV